MKKLENKVAVIYRDGSVGGAIAKAFARQGARVFLTGRTLTKLDSIANEILFGGGAIEKAQLKALDEQAVEKHMNEVIKQSGKLTFLSTLSVFLKKVFKVFPSRNLRWRVSPFQSLPKHSLIS